ncbi:MAG: radical SAM/Cys-rich domain protein [Dehalobacter sp. 4CP]|uniref:arsenosugar biosynthesis radical SAM (seleno)protein ArsS n=1 Tax=Dehalobacter sp. CP TaxID=2594474 RepID=UPI0013CB3ACE|nr:radical SAM/Cys-rich domain protein [Dehalobacter sp. 4CP]
MKLTDHQNAQLLCLESLDTIKPFAEKVKEVNTYPLLSCSTIETMQVNTGKVCNLGCKHCHVEAGPHRTESMSKETMAACFQVMSDNDIKVLDVTGGAPELNPNLCWLIREAAQLKYHIMLRTNLTLLDQPEYAHLPEFFAAHQVELISSLPYYSEKDADRQRGSGVFQKSIQVLSNLNKLGYGKENSHLKLNLVYNPGGAFLPAAQQSLEADYRRVLLSQYEVSFHKLFAMANFPVGRFLTFLQTSGNLQQYMERLANTFNASTLNNLMCRNQISVSWDGYAYDCDFNQMLGLACNPRHISRFSPADFKKREIRINNHCYACTAGSGSSCGGAVA